MMSLEAKVQEMDEMLAQALGVVSDLLGTVKEMRAAEESHRRQTQAALRTAASERSSLASAIERVRKGFETPDARELRSKIENLGSRIAIVGGDYQKMREELADVTETAENAYRAAEKRLSLLENRIEERTYDVLGRVDNEIAGSAVDCEELRSRLGDLEDRMEKVEAAPAVGPFLTPYDGSSGERQWKQLGPSDIPYDTGTPIRNMGSWSQGPVWLVDPRSWDTTDGLRSYFGAGGASYVGDNVTINGD